MDLSPLLVLELQRGARRKRLFQWRTLVALFLLVVLTLHYGIWEADSRVGLRPVVPNFAREYFYGYAHLQLIIVLLIGPAIAGAAIASQREARTLQDLLLTPLSTLDIIIAKFLLAVLKIGNFLLLGVPILAFSLLLGGVGWATIQWMAAVTLSTLVAVVGLSLGVSGHCRTVRQALVATYVILAAWLFLLPVLLPPPGMSFGPPVDTVLEALIWGLAAHPFLVLDQGLRQPAGPTWTELAPLLTVHGIIATLGVLEGARMLRRVDLLTPAPRSTRALRPARRWSLGSQPVLWKEVAHAGSRLGSLGLLVWRCGLVLVAAASWNVASRGLLVYRMQAFEWTALFACVALLYLTLRAAGSISIEREQQTWESLLLTGLSGEEILIGKSLGCVYALRWEWAFVLWQWFALLYWEPELILTIAVKCLALGVGIVLSCLIGLSASIRCQSSATAMGFALFGSCAIGSGLGCCSMGSLPAILTFTFAKLPISKPELIGSLFYFALGAGAYWALCFHLWGNLRLAFEAYGRTPIGSGERPAIGRDMAIDRYFVDLQQGFAKSKPAFKTRANPIRPGTSRADRE